MVKLLEFQNEIDGFESYSDGFGLPVDDKSRLHSWSTDEKLLGALQPFAQANGSGSFYALWLNNDGKNLSEVPVVIFGDEGGAHIVAATVADLLRLLTFDSDPMVDHEEVPFYKDDDFEASDDASAYKSWLKKELNLQPVSDPEEIMVPAQKQYGAAFAKWFGKFVAE